MRQTALRQYLAYLNFLYRNYMRSHRYLRELVVVVIFHIFFWGFLYSNHPEDPIWWVFSVFAVLLNLVTTPSVFLLERGNTLHFLLARPHGRRFLLLAKVGLIVLIDLALVAFFAGIYGLRFLSASFFLHFPVRLAGILWILLLSTLLLSLAYSYRPQLSWLLMVLLIFGGIVNKAALLPVRLPGQFYKWLALALPPFFEISYLLVSLKITPRALPFLIAGLIQLFLLGWISYRGWMRRDFV
ncbi:MAG: hypothetical protein D6715_05480 [Calditrichaeota bacterium]|nr:MAG: hypothetical protein D6715_05480 [Calditrichota bacterium]